MYWKTLSSAATLVENCKIFTCYLRVNRTQLKHLKTIKAQRWERQKETESKRWNDEVLLQALICARVAAVPFAFSRINRALSFAIDRAIKIQTNKHSLVIRHSRGQALDRGTWERATVQGNNLRGMIKVLASQGCRQLCTRHRRVFCCVVCVVFLFLSLKTHFTFSPTHFTAARQENQQKHRANIYVKLLNNTKAEQPQL